MSDGENSNQTDAATEITDAMMSSLADVVKTTISAPLNEEIAEEKTVSEPENIVALEENSGPVTTVEDLVAEGEAAHRSGDHSSALIAFNKAIALDPSNSMAWFNRGVLLEAEQDPRGAKQSFVICLDLDPQHGPALANLAVLLDRLGEVDGAVEITQRALHYFPGHPHLVKILESNKAAGGVNPSTPKVMPHTQDKLVNQNLTTKSVNNVEMIEQEQNPPPSDEGDLLPALSESPTDFNESPFDEPIIEQHEEVVEDLIEDVAEEIVEEVIEEIVEEVVDIDSICATATNYLANGDAKNALQILKEHLHGIAAQHFDSWRIAAGSMAAMGLDDHAIGAYSHAIGLNPSDAKCHFNLGALHERKGNVADATNSFVKAVESDQNYSKAAERLAIIADTNGDIENLLKARRFLANSADGKLELATLLVELAEGEARILENTAGLPPTIPEGPALANEAISLCEHNTPLMGRALSASGNHTDAVKCWKFMIQSDKSNPDLWIGLARSLEAAGDMTTAQRCHEKAHALSNPNPEPVSALPETVTAVPTQSEPEANLQQEAQFSPQVNSEIVNHAPQPATNQFEPEIQQPLPDLTSRPEPEVVVKESNPVVDLAAAALEATSKMEAITGIDSNSNAIANQDIEWYNKGVGLIEDKKYREALSCFDRALPSFADNDEMVIRILNGRGNALYYLEEYPKCVESYHKAMVINPSGVQGKTLYNMGTAYAEMQRFADAIKCFEQAMPRGLDKSQQKLAKEQIRRCNILLKEQQRKMS